MYARSATISAIITLVACLATTSMAVAQEHTPFGPHAKATGDFRQPVGGADCGYADIVFDAHEDPSDLRGEDWGQWDFDRCDGVYYSMMLTAVEVDCAGGSATMVGTVTESNFFDNGDEIKAMVIDNGEPGSHDEAGATADINMTPSTTTILDGNIQVHCKTEAGGRSNRP